LNPIETLSHQISSIVELPQDVDVIQMQKNVKTTCQNILWLCKHEQKTRHPKIKIFFSLNYTTFLNY